MKVSNLKDKPISVLAYGNSGTGKTHLSGTLGELGKVLIIDIENGTSTLANTQKISTLTLDNVSVVDFEQFEDINALAVLINKNTPADWNKALKDPTFTDAPFDWIVWDSWTRLQFVMKEKLRSEKGIKGTNIAYRKNLEIQHWGMLTDLNNLATDVLLQTKVNQMFIMLETVSKEELTGQVTGGPAIHGKLVAEFPALFDVVIRTYTSQSGGYMATTKPKSIWIAKSRISTQQEYPDPTMKKLLGL